MNKTVLFLQVVLCIKSTTNMKKLIVKTREIIFYFLVEIVIPSYVKLRPPKKPRWNLSVQDLLAFPKDTLGNALGLFLQKRNLKPIPNSEEHDVLHLILGYKTEVEDEIRMQFFLLGNGKITLSVLGTMVVGLLMPEVWGKFIRDFKRGATSPIIYNINFKKRLNRPIDEVLLYLNTNPTLSL